MSEAALALREVERALKELHLAWNTAEGRRGRIADQRKALAAQKAEMDAQREAVRQEQWKLKKESTTLQHARDEAEAMGQQIAELAREREETRTALRSLLGKVKAVSGELRS
jgi:hypothetical protein